MANIKSTYINDNRLAMVKVEGILTADEAVKAIEAFYAQDVPLLVLIDYSEADISQITEAQLVKIVQTVGKHACRRKGGKTALVMPTNLKYGIGRMVEAFYDWEVHAVEAKSFRTIDEAKQWLGVGEPK